MVSTYRLHHSPQYNYQWQSQRYRANAITVAAILGSLTGRKHCLTGCSASDDDYDNINDNNDNNHNDNGNNKYNDNNNNSDDNVDNNKKNHDHNNDDNSYENYNDKDSNNDIDADNNNGNTHEVRTHKWRKLMVSYQ